MVDYNDIQLDLVFSALGDPNRRAILTQLQKGPVRLSDLQTPSSMSLTAVSKHIRVLEKAGLVLREKRGREQICGLDIKALKQAGTWIGDQQRFWENRFERLDDYLQMKKEEET